MVKETIVRIHCKGITPKDNYHIDFHILKMRDDGKLELEPVYKDMLGINSIIYPGNETIEYID